MDVAIGAAAGDFDEYATILSHHFPSKNSQNWHSTPLQNCDFKSEDR